MSAARVLIVDDNVDLAENLAEILEDEGLGCDVARSGETAIEQLAKRDYDLVISDMRMDGMSGLDLLRTINDRWPRIPVVVMTAYARDHQVNAAREEGAIDILSKPMDAEALIGLVSDLAAGQAASILLVEDDDDLRDNLAEVLDLLEGSEVIAVRSVKEARRHLDDRRFDIAVIDVRLPDGSGVALGQDLCAEPTRCPRLIFMTAYTNEIRGALRQLTDLTNPPVLEKPFPPSALVAVVRRAGLSSGTPERR